MKRFKNIALGFLTAALTLNSCNLDEINYATVDLGTAYEQTAGYNALINACYENIYYLYGKQDGIGPMEMGTDLWMNGGRTSSQGDITNYTETLNSDCGVVKVCWNALYCIVSYCNTAIYYQDKVKDNTEEELKGKTAEAYFLRAFANFHIVEQWGNVVLNKQTMAQPDIETNVAIRSNETEFYDLIISDLKTAVEHLPVIQSERGRASKKAAQGMLAKAYLQRTRLCADEASKKLYADSAFVAATELIDNQAQYNCGLYASTADKSGFGHCWDPENNKSNSEFLFLEAVDHINGYNPEGWNRGRTAQYYLMELPTIFGIEGDGMRYRRANARIWRPTRYLMQEVFEPKEDTKDTRFADSFYYKYYASNATAMSIATLKNYRKDSLALIQNGYSVRKASTYTITSNAYSSTEMQTKYPGFNYYCDNGASAVSALKFVMEDKASSLAAFLPNWDLDTLSVTVQGTIYLAAGPNMYFNEEGGQTSYSYLRNFFPSLKKYSSFKYLYTNQYSMQDVAILRLTDIYLIAAEASILMQEPSKGLPYLNKVREHAALAADAANMQVTSADMTIDFILKERGRELCGEQWRWYDLKRTGYLTQEYLGSKWKNPYITNFSEKHLRRPIPQSFLNQISNPAEFGNNNY